MTDRENALLMQLEIERLGKAHRLPYICIIAIPDENGCTRASLSLMGKRNADNRAAFIAWLADYFAKLSSMP